jgi:hypothetical protein
VGGSTGGGLLPDLQGRDEDQTGVDRQERLCREVAERLGLVIVPGGVFVDNNRSARTDVSPHVVTQCNGDTEGKGTHDAGNKAGRHRGPGEVSSLPPRLLFPHLTSHNGPEGQREARSLYLNTSEDP